MNSDNAGNDVDIDLFSDFTEEEVQANKARTDRLNCSRLESIEHFSKDPTRRSLAQNRLVFRYTYSTAPALPFTVPSLLSIIECQDILDKISLENSEWLTSRHSAFATTDIPVSSIPDLAIRLPALLNDRLLSKWIAPHFRFHPTRDLAFRDLFIVRYSHDAQKSLQMHTDGCLISFNILLNSHTDFQGGGTLFEGLDDPVKIKQGDCVIHDAHLRHGGMEVISGVRLILVGFIDTTDTITKDNIGRTMS
ncbi:hypothetical protein BGW37DRAFT_489817 [Umbelopsis sp. PMI_123]|nr:hypothetical protein BGW37DRAFT_489817 [Umbelopsis sp. PMI_123]